MNIEAASNAIVAVTGFYAGALAAQAESVQGLLKERQLVGEHTARLADENARLSHRVRQLEAQAGVAKEVVTCATAYLEHVGTLTPTQQTDGWYIRAEDLRDNLENVLEGYGDGDASAYQVA